ncbi:Cupredoxin [Mycena sanguinolenta]|nr:Cupredoxin [Mycena sanguinolenta]
MGKVDPSVTLRISTAKPFPSVPLQGTYSLPFPDRRALRGPDHWQGRPSAITLSAISLISVVLLVSVDNPLTRDTLIIQPGTWVVLRFVGNNPGVWTFHCHIAWHITAGLLLQFNIQPSKIAQLVLPESVTGECPS